MRVNIFLNLLEYPAVYSAVQSIMAPGGEMYLRKRINHLIAKFSTRHNLLDVGCGPASWLWHEDLNPVGLDLSFSYARAFDSNGGKIIVGSADKLPFSTGSFAGVWSVGLLHHMKDDVVSQAIKEIVRVCRPGGYVIIMDAVMPKRAWERPLAYWIRKMDRGQFMRRQLHLSALLPDRGNWSMKRYTYAATGLEMLEYIYQKQ